VHKAVVSLLLILSGIMLTPARAGHELPYYPSFYPHEIRLEVMDPGTAAHRLRDNTLHAYIGATPPFAAQVPGHLKAVASLGSYVVVTFDGEAARLWPREQRCTVAQALLPALAEGAGAYVFHPYPVTPYHEDYLYHFDRVEAVQAQYLQAAPRGPEAPTLRVRVRGALAVPLVQSGWPVVEQQWDATVEEVSLDELLARHTSHLNGWIGPPWLKAGWFHAYVLLAGTVGNQAVHEGVEAAYQRLVQGSYAGPEEGLTVARELVTQLLQGCERVVVGYTVRQEYVNADYSAGIENLAYDAHTGLNSPLFLRTVKLKDLPWNGWLRLGVSTPATAAWNPLGGCTDGVGRLLWSAVGDAAFFPAPYSAGWTPNRIAEYQTTIRAQERLTPAPAMGQP
jgi:hypothetical protein